MQEIWKDIKGYKGLYQISNIGRIKSLARWYKPKEAIRKNIIQKDGYFRVMLNKNNKQKYFRVCRLVAENFIPNPENKPEVNHKDGIKTHDYDYNLEWVTTSENAIHAFKLGLRERMRGEKCGTHKLTEGEVKYIRWIASNVKVERGYWTKLAQSLNISRSQLSGIIHNRNWKHI